tara:strand:+ start:75 stop:218 length:144 start_codon:yes stop_codon:yes gene_type:complete
MQQPLQVLLQVFFVKLQPVVEEEVMVQDLVFKVMQIMVVQVVVQELM